MFEFDYLVIALGATSNYYNLPGAEENTLPLKSTEDAIKIHNRTIENFESAMIEVDEQKQRELLAFVIVGGGPTGVELCATMALFLFKTIARDFPCHIIAAG